MHRIFFLFVFLLTSARGQKEGQSCVDDYTNTIGRCTALDACPSAQQDYQQSGINSPFCSYNASGVRIVCCRDGSNILNTANRSQDDRPIWGIAADLNDSRRVSEKKCEEYSRSVVKTEVAIPLIPTPEMISVSEANCQYNVVELIVGEQVAKLGEFPHMAAIGWADNSSGYQFKCSGSLISPRYVLTSAHCSYDRYLESEPVVVRLGDQNIDNNVRDGADPEDAILNCQGRSVQKDEAICTFQSVDLYGEERARNSTNYKPKPKTPTSGIKVAIRRFIKHPKYQAPKIYDDIALIELVADVKLRSAIRPACLWNKPDLAQYRTVIATGWGQLNSRTEETSKELQKIPLPLLDINDCNATLQALVTRNWRYGVIDSQICAGELKGVKGTCQGGPGAPIQVVARENSCIFHIVGVTSLGKNCGDAGRTAVYTRVSSYLDWIEGIVWPGQ